MKHVILVVALAFISLPTLHGKEPIGIRVKSPGADLRDQLEIPKGRGVVLVDVENAPEKESATLKRNDILLEIDGKEVPSNPLECLQMVDALKQKEGINVLLLRKGKLETIKGIQLTQATGDLAGRGNRNGEMQDLHYFVQISGDQFTGTFQNGDFLIVAEGRFQRSRGVITKVKVTENGKTTTYPSSSIPGQARRYLRLITPRSIYR